MNTVDTADRPATRNRVVNPWTYQDQLGYSQAVVVPQPSQTVYVAGQLSLDAAGTPVHLGDMAGQLAQVADNIETVLQATGLGLADVVRYDVYTTDVAAYFGAAHVLVNRFAAAGTIPCGGICAQVTGLAIPGMLVEIVCTAAR